MTMKRLTPIEKLVQCLVFKIYKNFVFGLYGGYGRGCKAYFLYSSSS